jgi:hypothetical protein
MGSLLPVVKFGVAALAGIPVTKIVNDVVKNNVTIVTQADKVMVKAGGFIIGSMIAASLKETTDGVVDAVVAIKNRTQKTEETTETEES